MQGVEIDNVEACKRDALQEHELQVRAKPRAVDEFRQHARRVRTVAPNHPGEDALQLPPGVDRAHDQHIAAMAALERGVIEADDVGEPPGRSPRPQGAIVARLASRRLPSSRESMAARPVCA